MVENEQDRTKYRLAGYTALIERYDLEVIPNPHKSLVTASGIQRIDSRGGIIEEIYPSKNISGPNRPASMPDGCGSCTSF
jgi:hypothetical protein